MTTRRAHATPTHIGSPILLGDCVICGHTCTVHVPTHDGHTLDHRCPTTAAGPVWVLVGPPDPPRPHRSRSGQRRAPGEEQAAR